MPATPTRLYAVQLRTKVCLVEARSQEAAVQKATAPSVKKVWIPTPMEALRLQNEGAQMMTSVAGTASPAPESEQHNGGSVGRMALGDANRSDSGESHDDGAGESGEEA